MAETVTLKGQSFNLKGTLPKEGTILPDCVLTDENLKDVKLSSFKGRALLLMSVPSLDTPTCSKEAHRFNKEMTQFKESLRAVVVSMDLPFAQKRWCAAEGATNLVTLSDFKSHDFGNKFGVRIEELGLLARAVFLCDQNLMIKKVFLVKEVSEEPNYAKVLEAIHQLSAAK